MNTYKLLCIKYNEKSTAATELYKSIAQITTHNTEIITSIFEAKFHQQERVKVFALCAGIIVMGVDPDMMKTMNKVTMKQSYIPPINSNEEMDEFKVFETFPELLKHHTRSLLLDTASYKNMLGEKLRSAVKGLCGRFFQMPFKKFYSALVKFILREEDDKELLNHHNYNILIKVRSAYELFYNNFKTQYTTELIEPIFKSMYATQKIAILPLDDDYPSHSCESTFSQRSLQSLLGIGNVDIYSLFKCYMDD